MQARPPGARTRVRACDPHACMLALGVHACGGRARSTVSGAAPMGRIKPPSSPNPPPTPASRADDHRDYLLVRGASRGGTRAHPQAWVSAGGQGGFLLCIWCSSSPPLLPPPLLPSLPPTRMPPEVLNGSGAHLLPPARARCPGNPRTYFLPSKRFPLNNFKHFSTLFSKFFSAFPHSTCSLSVSHQHLVLEWIYLAPLL
jgi:hypothetical protein